MIKKLQQTFALTEKGAKGLVTATIWTAICNISLMFPVGLLFLVLREIISSLNTGVWNIAYIWIYTGLAVLLLIIMFIFHWFQYKSLYINTYTESASRRINLAEKLRKLPLSFFGKRDLSDLTSTMMADCSFLEQAFSHYIPQLFGSFVSTVLIAIGLLAMDWRMGLACLWVLPVSALIVLGSKWLQDKFATKSILAKRAATDGIQECLETIQDIKACNQKETYLNGVRNQLKKEETATIHSELATGVCVTSGQMFLRLGMVTTIIVGGSLLIAGKTDLLTYLIFLIAAARLYDPLSIVMTNIAATLNAKLQIERMKTIESQPIQTGVTEYTPKGYDIQFDHVSFAYNKEEGVLSDISFTAKQGEVTALVGPSGGGKSTAAKLAARFWDVNTGKITLGGVDVAKVEPEALLKNYAVVFQDVVLFHDTILENIRLGRRGATDEEVLEAAKAAQCDSFVSKLPDGYHTTIGENGSTLSGGERQRISIARALLKDAPVILLDEVTASLDVENETEVQNALSHLIKNKTVLVIAHRMRTVASADKIMVLENGRIAEQGSPKELMAKQGLFYRMVSLQQETSNWKI